MNPTSLLIILCVVLAAILDHCSAAPPWRPQGRFGKRTVASSGTGMKDVRFGKRTEDTTDRYYWRPQTRFGKRMGDITEDDSHHEDDFSHFSEIPEELFASARELASRIEKERLCSLGGLPGYPLCEQ